MDLRRNAALAAVSVVIAAAAACGGEDDDVALDGPVTAAPPDTVDTGDLADLAGEIVTFDLAEVNNSGATDGTVELRPLDATTTDVTVHVAPDSEEGDERSPAHPAHIHTGSCDELGGVAYPLEDVVGGVSESRVDVGIDELLEGDYAINVHESADEIDTYVACGDISE